MTRRKQAWEYIVVVRLPNPLRHHRTQQAKTRCFEIRLTDGVTVIGQVKWHVREHRYVFKSDRHPLAPTKSSEILKDIARFIDLLMAEHAKGIA